MRLAQNSSGSRLKKYVSTKILRSFMAMFFCVYILGAASFLTGVASGQASIGFAEVVSAEPQQSQGSMESADSDLGSNSRSRNRYVAVWGKDTNPGTYTQPWRTIQHAADSAEAGDTIYVRGGVYRELVTVSHSGTEAAGYITFQSYPGETAILDGASITPPSNTWSAFFYLVDQNYIVIKGFEMRNYFANLPGQQPAGVLVVGKGSHIEISENRIHNVQVLRDANTSCDPDSCNGHGIAIYGQDPKETLNHIVVARNEVYNLKTGWSETVTVDGNVEHWRIVENRIHHNDNIGIDAAGFYGFDPDPKTDFARDGTIARNSVYDIDTMGNPAYLNPDGTYSRFAAGIYVDGGAAVVIERNDSHENDLGVEVASENTGHNSDQVMVRNNLIYRSLNIGIAIGGYAPTAGGTSNTKIVNNTFYGNDTLHAGFGEFFIQSNVTNCVFENNLLYANSQGLFISNYVPFNEESVPVDVDYNLYFSPDGESGSNWMWNNVYYTGYQSYRSASHNDAHSPFANPLFIDRTASHPNLRVRANSPALDAGIDLGPAVVGRYDYAGDPRVRAGKIDIGAYEHLSN
jgi:Right handed beta helix region